MLLFAISYLLWHDAMGIFKRANCEKQMVVRIFYKMWQATGFAMSLMRSMVLTALLPSFITASTLSPGEAEKPVAYDAGLSISLAEFRLKIDSLFSDPALESLMRQLPSSGEVWGYDVGDFSGDGRYDVAVTVRQPRTKVKQVTAYFFVNEVDAFFLADSMSLPYSEIPIEVGFTIERGTCFVTTKLEQHHWMIRGYRYSDGMFMMVDKYEVTRTVIDPSSKFTVGYETYVNYRTFRSTENFFNPANGKSYWKAEFATIPAFPLNRNFPPDVSVWLTDTSAIWIVCDSVKSSAAADQLMGKKGDAENFKSTEIAVKGELKTIPFKLSAWYDSDQGRQKNLYLDVGIKDTSMADTLFFWFDRDGMSKIMLSDAQKPIFRSSPDEGVFRLAVVPRFSGKSILVQAAFVNPPGEFRRLGLKELRAAVHRNPYGYEVRLLVPAKLFNTDSVPSRIGFTFELHRTVSKLLRLSYATSRIEPWEPLTFGQMDLINQPIEVGYLRNIKLREIATLLRDLGLN